MHEIYFLVILMFRKITMSRRFAWLSSIRSFLNNDFTLLLYPRKTNSENVFHVCWFRTFNFAFVIFCNFNIIWMAFPPYTIEKSKLCTRKIGLIIGDFYIFQYYPHTLILISKIPRVSFYLPSKKENATEHRKILGYMNTNK